MNVIITNGITLLEAVGKVSARLLLNRFTEYISPKVVPETQYSFRSGRGTVDMAFSFSFSSDSGKMH